MKTVKFQKASDNNKKVLSPEAKSKRRQLKVKFNIDKDKLNEQDILKIMTAIDLEVKDNGNVVEQSKKLLKKIDKDNLGYVNTNDFIEEIINRNDDLIQDEFTLFYKKINENLYTKSEEIILRLKKLQNKPFLTGKPNLTKSIEVIINVISSGNLYDIDSHVISKGKNEGEDFLKKYSQIEDSNRKENDFIQMRKHSKKYSSNSLNKSLSINNRRRSTNLSTLVSPSIVASMYDQMIKIDKCDFNIFELDALLGKKAVVYVATEILNRFPFVDSGDIPSNTLKNFITQIVEHYDREKAIYHNDLHAGDVMQTSFTVFNQGNLRNKMKLKDLDLFAMLVAALCHDYKHPGTNNIFQINTRSKYALRYNDTSVLEMYHIAQTFKELKHDEYNIFKKFSPEEYRICRRRMIDGVLATDMANHQKVLSGAKTLAETFNIKKGKNFENVFNEQKDNKSMVKLFDTQQTMLNMIIHTADISNPGKPDKISAEWTKRVYGEFFIQGDMEKKLNITVSMFCDRETTNINKAMIGFISFVVGPTIDTLTNLIPEVYDYTEYCRSNLRKHKIGAKNDEKKEAAEKKKKLLAEKNKK